MPVLLRRGKGYNILVSEPFLVNADEATRQQNFHSRRSTTLLPATVRRVEAPGQVRVMNAV